MPHVFVSYSGPFTFFEEHDVNFTRDQSGFGLFSVSSVLANDFLPFAFDTLAPHGAVSVDYDLSFTAFVRLCTFRLRFRVLLALWLALPLGFAFTLAIAVEVSRSILCELVEGTIERLEIRLVAEGSDGVIAARTQIAESVIAALVCCCCGRL